MIGRYRIQVEVHLGRRGAWLAAINSLLLLVLLAATSSLAQTTATIHGQVKDSQGLAIPDAAISVACQAQGISRSVKSDNTGEFVVVGLPAGRYEIGVSKAGFQTRQIRDVELTVNQEITTSIELSPGTVMSEVLVTGELPLLDTTTSSSGSTITPTQVSNMPLNGRNYLDLMQLVPGITVNRQVDQGGDASTPVLGQRGNNAQFLIDGMPNTDDMNGGAAAQFNQDAILEFQVLTAGYKAEFGHGSGGVINVVSKSGTNNWHGLGSAFLRTSDLDSSNASQVNGGNVPFLKRWDPSFQFGGPIVKDKVFMFAAIERIMESRALNFQFPDGTPLSLQQLENSFNGHTLDNETRMRTRFDEGLGHHRLTEQVNFANSHINNFNPLSASTSLPSTRKNIGQRHLMLGISDVATLGDQANPFLLNYYFQYRDEPWRETPSHPGAGIATTDDYLFSSLTTGDIQGDLGIVTYGPGFNALPLHQKYFSLGANLAKVFGRHAIKFGWEYQHMIADGTESTNYYNQLFNVESDLATYSPEDSGMYYLNVQGGSAASDQIKLRNNYTGLFVQDDWKLAHNLTVNLGFRWDYDSTFPNTKNYSPRIGVAWEVRPKTVVRASWGRFYDHFRLGVGRDIPAFGGASVVRNRYLSFPRLFYGDPSILTQYWAGLVGLNVPCLSTNLTDAQIPGSGQSCWGSNLPLYGIDHLNSIGTQTIPAGAVVKEDTVQNLSGLTPGQFLDAASAAVGQAPGYFTWDPFGHLGTAAPFAAYNVPITVSPGFATPFTDTFHFGVQQQLTSTLAVSADYYHSTISNMLGVRATNLAFEARIDDNTLELQPGTGSVKIAGFGPWYDGFYDGLTIQVSKRMSRRVQFEASYTYSKEWDNMLNSNLTSEFQTASGAAYTAEFGPTDSYVGMVPVVTEPHTGQTNAHGAFIDGYNGNPVPQAGKFYNGANLDYGPSDLSVPHMFSANATVNLPWKFEVSPIFRVQSGFAYLRASANPPDVDGDGILGVRDINYVRNSFRAPKLFNLDTRLGKTFKIRERFKVGAYFEMFNLFNNANPAAMQQLPGQPTPFGEPMQILPGREGQVGLRIEF